MSFSIGSPFVRVPPPPVVFKGSCSSCNARIRGSSSSETMPTLIHFKVLCSAAMLASVAAQAAKSFHERRRALSPPGLLFTRVRPRRSLVAACTRRRRRRRRHRRSSSSTTTTTTSTALRQNETHSRIVAQRLHARVGDDLIVVPVASQKAPVPGPGKPLLQGRRVQLGDAAFALGRAGAELTHHHRLVELVALHAAHARAERAADVKDATAVRA